MAVGPPMVTMEPRYAATLPPMFFLEARTLKLDEPRPGVDCPIAVYGLLLLLYMRDMWPPRLPPPREMSFDCYRITPVLATVVTLM